MNHKKFLTELIDNEIQLSILEVDRNKLKTVKNKILSDEELSNNEKNFIIQEVLSQKLTFDSAGNPTKNTLIIERLIDLFNS
jgi:hypothetical protein